MPGFTRNEQIDMILIYGECRKNAYASKRLYLERYPLRNQPSRRYFSWLEGKLRSVPVAEENERFIINEETEINVLALIEINKTYSIRQIAYELDISRESTRKILKKHGYRCYKYQLHQNLYEIDSERRIEFCQWILQRIHLAPNFVSTILFTDESRFTNNGMFNRNNTRYWSRENENLIIEGNFQERFGVNVWAGIVGEHLVGPILFEGHLNGNRYLDFLQNDIEGHIQNLPLNLQENLYFMQDGAPPHNARQVTDYLENRFGNNVIANRGPIRWPPRSPDLTPCDYFLWAHLKNMVYRTPPTNLEDLENRIIRAFQSITPAMLANVLRENLERFNKCLEVAGSHFEHLLN